MAPGYAVALVLEAAGTLGLLCALVSIRRERLSKAAGLRSHFGDGLRRRAVGPRIVSVSVQSSPTSAPRGEEASARAALVRALAA